ncbi:MULTISPECIES: ABC transporter permease [Thermodesulfovibrio]|jgi:peptide/nickel transport system permease protein|uniref:Oligopeptide transport system permease protein AppB n=1 Tax=Thermodesulfovibrio yellowstonii (strain ATCC 51303 / DSM 11347 / YP87) TaxID=289376 RepID=B5YKJ9_THEYD|nr:MULTISPECIES: ABC transporter permease [Thermodesulfovibrio]ACI21666.1 oligopeptide transport system permease protein AppB [Thermodesulfovibrio yellowstonii DSM 11347]MDI6865648.1 ABC transporter permease [Thermodesulfovibrio yellowstonii]
MLSYLIKRFLLMIPILFGITLICFIVINLAPGSPATFQEELSPKASPEAVEALKKLYGLDKPIHERYLNWLKMVVTLDLGKSFVDGRNVKDKIKERLPITVTLNLFSLLLILIIAIPIGVYSALKQGSLFDRALTVFVFTGFSVPTFWLALLAMIVFGVNLGWLPISGIQSIGAETMPFHERLVDWIKHLILPVTIMSFAGLAGMSRYTRSSMLEVLRQDYIRTARSKGLPERVVIIRYALRNALLPVVTLLGLAIPGLIGGSVIFESIFSIPGMGQLFYSSAMARDYPTIMGILIIGALLTLIGNLIADIAYFIVDPRIRVKRDV